MERYLGAATLLGLTPSLGPAPGPAMVRLVRLKVDGDQQEEWLGLISTRGKLVGSVRVLAGVVGDWVMQMVGRMVSRLRVEGC